MSSRRGRLNWSNLEVHISDDVIEKQHHFNIRNSLSSTSTSTENIIEEEKEISPTSPSIKRSWMPKNGVGEMQAEQFVGNFMLTTAEQTAIDKKYNKQTSNIECSKVQTTIDKKYNKQASNIECSKVLAVSKPIRISNRLPSIRDTPISTRTTNLFVGQHLLNVFVCHVETYSCVHIMFGDDYNRATKLFHDMNTCDELIQPSTIIFEPKENDLVALYHEKKWFRGRCLNSTGTNINVLCIDSGVVITCLRNDLRRLPDM